MQFCGLRRLSDRPVHTWSRALNCQSQFLPSGSLSRSRLQLSGTLELEHVCFLHNPRREWVHGSNTHQPAAHNRRYEWVRLSLEHLKNRTKRPLKKQYCEDRRLKVIISLMKTFCLEFQSTLASKSFHFINNRCFSLHPSANATRPIFSFAWKKRPLLFYRQKRYWQVSSLSS